MHSTRTAPLLSSALLSVALATASGCSSSSTTTTTTVARPTTTTTTTTNPLDLPATGAVDGVTLSVMSSPLTGTVGSTTMSVSVVLKGAVVPAHLEYQITDAASAGSGRAATSQVQSVSRAGSYHLPSAFRPPSAGSWAVTVTYAPESARKSKLSVSGLPPRVGLPAPFPQLVTVVTAG